MSVCNRCYTHMTESHEAEIRKLYRAVADGEPKLEIMHMIYQAYGRFCDLAPPATEIKIAELCNHSSSRV
jgi:hypothetical protein